LLITFSVVTKINAQTAKLTGKIIGENNKPIAAASITIIGQKGGTTSNFEGIFTLTLSIGKKYEIEISAIGYATKRISDIEVKANETNEITLTLDTKAKELKDVVVKTSSVKKETTNALIAYQRNTGTVTSVVSAEAIRRSPDKNTGEVLKRIPGASIQEGKFLVVRGLSDRYNAAMLNGVPLTSSEPDRKTFAFDLIPSGMIDNIIVNKAFSSENSGEWAGGLVQINTKDIPTRSFFNVQIGMGINTQVIGNNFYGYNKGKYDFLGIDDGGRALPELYKTKSVFDASSQAQKNAIGLAMNNQWTPQLMATPLNTNLQMSGGFTGKFLGKQMGGIFGITYNKANRSLQLGNNQYNFGGGGTASLDYSFNDAKYTQDVLWGALGNVSIQLNNNNKISYKTLFNVNSTNYANLRTGIENFGSTPLDSVKAYELQFQQNMFWSNQIIGEHNLIKPDLKFKWFGSFNILDGYQPDQRRILYRKSNTTPNQPYEMLIADVLSQRSGNRFNQMLNEYIYTAGADVSKSFKWFGQNQSFKAGYLFQVRDRLFDAMPFSIGLVGNNPSLIRQSAEQAFVASNFSATGENGKFYFDAIKGNRFRYLANSILNAGFFQFDNQLTSKWRLLWGLRIEDFDQLVGSVKKTDPRFTNSRVTDFLPSLNLTYKLNAKTNVRFSATQTVVRPEFRELATFEFYDFEVNAAVQGNPNLKRTKITNLDVRYELYPNAGEIFNVGVFYKNFQNPIEQVFIVAGGGASTFVYTNPQAANSIGAELEFRKKLDVVGLRNFTIQTNFAYIHSRIKDDALASAGLLKDRPMQGQSPYVVNVGLLYDVEKLGLNITLLYNQIGERISLVGNNVVPDIWEASRPIFDFQVSKKILKNRGEVKLNIQDILNRPLYFYQNLDGKNQRNAAVDVDRFSRRFGTNISLSLAYNFK
ncbi:MAG: TonB-dependent receptor domain-containing protein, partial [Chitinophagaceae bacterium]